MPLTPPTPPGVYTLQPDVTMRLCEKFNIKEGATAAAQAAVNTANAALATWNNDAGMVLSFLGIPADAQFSIDFLKGTLTVAGTTPPPAPEPDPVPEPVQETVPDVVPAPVLEDVTPTETP